MIFRSGFFISRAVAVALCLAALHSGCSDPLSSADGARRDAPGSRAGKDRYEILASDAAIYRALLKGHQQGEPRALRVKVDTVRNRLWVLSLKHIYIYDIAGQQLIRRVALPQWSVAGFVCPPDMALDQSGAAFLTSNVESTLWKIDAEDFRMHALEVTLQADANRSIGFGAATFAADGALYALTAHEGWLWRIDTATLRGSEVALSERLLNTCTLTASHQRIQSRSPSMVVICAASGKHYRTVGISPDFTRGQVSNEKCPS